MPVWRGLFVATASWNIIALAVYVLSDFYSLLVIALFLLGGAFFENEEEKRAIMSVQTFFFSYSHLFISFRLSLFSASAPSTVRQSFCRFTHT